MIIKLLAFLLLPHITLVSTAADNGAPIVKGDRTVYEASGWRKQDMHAVQPIITAAAAVVLDAKTGEVLYKKNENEIRPVASITKLMTAYTYLKKIENPENEIITMHKDDIRNGGKHMVYENELGTGDDFLHLALIGSDNSAAMALARGGGFLEMYGETTDAYLRKFGLTKTHFIEPSGLAEGNVSTAYEIAELARHVFKEEKIAAITQKSQFYFTPLNTTTTRVVDSTNILLGTPLFSITGGKTGYTDSAGHSVVIRVENKAGKAVVISVLGAKTDPDRFQDAKILAWWVFENFN